MCDENKTKDHHAKSHVLPPDGFTVAPLLRRLAKKLITAEVTEKTMQNVGTKKRYSSSFPISPRSLRLTAFQFPIRSEWLQPDRAWLPSLRGIYRTPVPP